MAKKPRYYYGWNIVAASFLANMAYSEHFASTLGLFFKPLQKQFGWSRSALAAVQTIARLTEAAVAPFIGPYIDRHGPRVLMPIGAIITGLTMLGITQINAIWQFYLLRGVVSAIGFTLMGHLVTTVAINNWFVQKRGRALAISRIGIYIGNIICIPLTVYVIGASGWQTMYFIFAVISWLFVLLPAVILMRRRPEDMGLHPDGIEVSTAEAPESSKETDSHVESTSVPEPVWTRREVLMTRSFWLLSICYGVNSLAYQGINISLAPYIQDLGYPDAVLASVMTFRSVIAAVSLLPAGFVAERAYLLSVRVIPFLVLAAGAFLFLLAENPVILWLAASVYALTFSNILIIQDVIWANYYGRLSLGTVRSLALLSTFGFGAMGPIAMNIMYDVYDSYEPAFRVFIVLFLISAVLMTMARKPKPVRYATPEEIDARPGRRR